MQVVFGTLFSQQQGGLVGAPHCSLDAEGNHGFPKPALAVSYPAAVLCHLNVLWSFVGVVSDCQ